MPNFELWHSFRKWAIYIYLFIYLYIYIYTRKLNKADDFGSFYAPNNLQWRRAWECCGLRRQLWFRNCPATRFWVWNTCCTLLT
jgi:hypothetical protein